MATLYVENVPDELYEALRNRAKQHRKSIAGEVISLLEENVPTPQELKRRQRLFQQVLKLRAGKPVTPGPFPTTEEMQREDRER
jgi:plasmid stability protein